MSERMDVQNLAEAVQLPDGDARAQAQVEFGYDAEFEVLDRTVAKNYIQRHFRGPFYSLEHGLDQIPQKIYEQLRANPNVEIHLNTPVREITRKDILVGESRRPYDVLFVCVDRLDKICFRDVPIPYEERFSRPVELMRIFVRVESNHHLPAAKRTGPGPVRMWIPMGPNFAQIYTDSYWAEWWKKRTDEDVHAQVRTFLNDPTGSVHVVDREFWRRGVHVWTQAVRSSQLPFGRIWFAGELFATESFGWMEGALETVRAYFTD